MIYHKGLITSFIIMTSAGFAATGKNNYKTNSVLVSASTTIIAVQTLVAIQICRS